MLTVLEKVDLLQKVAIFQFIPTQDLARVASVAKEVSFEARRVLYTQNSAPDAMFVLLEGMIELLSPAQQRRVGEGTVVGAMAVLADEPHSESAVAIVPIRTIQIDQQGLFDSMVENFAVTRGILRTLVHKAAATD